MSEIRFPLPDVGEGLTEAEIVQWRVAPGDPVAVNDALVEIETAKSLVELPSPFAGTVGELLAAEGDTVEVGTAIITIASGGGTDAAGPATVGQSEHGVPSAPASDSDTVSIGARSSRASRSSVSSSRRSAQPSTNASRRTPSCRAAAPKYGGSARWPFTSIQRSSACGTCSPRFTSTRSVP